jgi:Fe-S cluster biogenesis protein NfuA
VSWLARFLDAFREPGADAPARGDPARIAAVERLIEELRPMLVADGGDIRVVSVEEGWVDVRLRGACRSCLASPMTLQGALEPRLRAELDWVRGVRAV